MPEITCETPQNVEAIPFSFLVSLFQEISKIKPRQNTRVATKKSLTPLQTLNKWITELRRRYCPLPPGTTAIFFRLLFPEEDTRRKYGMQEVKLAKYIAQAYAVSTSPHSDGERLIRWKNQDSSGCLGTEVERLAEPRTTIEESTISIFKIDALLTELASKCAYTDSSLRKNKSNRTPSHIIRELYAEVTPVEAAFITQIILKDLKPLLYPLAETHYTAALLKYNSNAISVITKEDAMDAWDPSRRMLNAYKVRACLDDVSEIFESGSHEYSKIQIGRPIEIPKCAKGQGTSQALNLLRGSEKIWAETKYDGERAQIHVEITADGRSEITIFSKSKRNSTLDRYAIHPIIRDALNLRQRGSTSMPSSASRIKKNIVVEAEMVAFSDTLNQIDEFWRIRTLIESTARGVRHVKPRGRHADSSQDSSSSQSSLASNASDDGDRHLALVFFDILLLDDASLLSYSYSDRRALLESIIVLSPGYSMLAQRVPILHNQDSSAGTSKALKGLRKVMAHHIANFEEGIVLKADESKYHDWKLPWVKLKKDYIEGYGDTLDLTLVGASWDKKRAGELRVAPTVYTTFYVGALSNQDVLRSNPSHPPHFEVFFTVEYGCSRVQLEELNFLVKSADPLPHGAPRRDGDTLSYTYSLFAGIAPPAVWLREPIAAEIMGGSFTKAAHNQFYELRFPRIAKFFRPSERPWTDSATLQDFQRIARESVGRDRKNKDVEDACDEIWGITSSPSVRCPRKRKEAENEWARKLARADRKRARTTDDSEDDNDGSEDDNDDNGFYQDIERTKARTPTPPPQLRPLRSSTNIAHAIPTSCSYPPHEPVPSELVPRQLLVQQQLTPPSASRFKKDGKQTRPPASVISDVVPHQHLEESIECIKNPTPIQMPEPAKIEQVELNHSLLTSREADKRDISVSAAVTEDSKWTAMGEFLRNAVVWLEMPVPRPPWLVPCDTVVPYHQRVHTLDALLFGCGWGGQPACDWADYGVVFVHDSADGSGSVWDALLDGRKAVLASGTRDVKPIWVFSTKMLSCEVRSVERDVESCAICKMG